MGRERSLWEPGEGSSEILEVSPKSTLDFVIDTIKEMGLTFEISNTAESGGRRGALTLPHGVVQTPVFMPVGTAATVKTVEQGVLERIGPPRSDGHPRGAEIILANTYHLYLRPGHELIARMGGVHRF